MSKFNVGDEVIVNKKSTEEFHWPVGSTGTIAAIDNSDGTVRVLFNYFPNRKGTNWCWVPEDQLDLVKSIKKKESKVQYEFKTSALVAVDYSKISEECTKETPIIFIESKADYSQLIEDTKAAIQDALDDDFTDLAEFSIFTNEVAQQVRDVEIDGLSSLLSEYAKAQELHILIHKIIVYKADMCGFEPIQSLFEDKQVINMGHCVAITQIEYSDISDIKAWAQAVKNAEWPMAAPTTVKVKSIEI